MSEPPKIAIVLPVFNGGRLLQSSVDSILGQTMSAFEFIICDDSSFDDSRSYLATIDDSRAMIMHNESNRGLFPTLNRLLMSVSAPLIHLWSQDDLMYPDCLEETIEFHRCHGELGMSWSQFDIIDSKGDVSNPAFNDHIRPEWVLSHELYAELSLLWGCLPFNIANVCLKSESVVRAGLFRENLAYSGDFEYWGRLAKIAPVGRIGKRLIQLRSHDAQFSAQLAARVQNISEALPISLELLQSVRGEFRKEMQRCFDWKVLPMSALTWWVCVKRKRWKLAGESWRRLRPFGSPLKAILTSLFVYVLIELKLDRIFYGQLFLNRHYKFLASIDFDDEGIPGWRPPE